MDFAIICPLARTGRPHIRFLFVGSRLCSTLPSDPASRRRPCASLVLHLHQVGQGTFTPKLSNMLGTQRNGAALAAPLRRTEYCVPSTHVPSVHPARYSSCSGVSLSILMPIDSSFIGDALVEFVGNFVDRLLELLVVLHHVLGAQGLVGEAHIHHAGGMALGRGQVDQAAFAEQVDLAAVFSVNSSTNCAWCASRRHLLERRDVDLHVEVAGVGRRWRRPSSASKCSLRSDVACRR